MTAFGSDDSSRTLTPADDTPSHGDGPSTEVEPVVDPVGHSREASEEVDGDERYRRLLTSSLSPPFTEGNRIRALRNGVEIFPAMLDAIRSATRSIEFETFVYWKGDIAYEMAEALAAAARRGVEVRVLLDAAGSVPMSDEIRRIMEESPVEVQDFGPLQPLRFWELDHRTHRKIMVCDGSVGFTGGVGIAEEWEGDARNPEEWREIHFQIEGPAVQGLRGTFLEHWLSTRDHRDGLPASLPYADRDPSVELDDGGATVQLVPSTAAGRWSNAQTLFRVLFQMARERIRITTAYFTPEEELVGLLRAARARDVEVDIIMPGPYIDHRVSQLAGESFYPELLEAGVRLWRYQPTMIHAKVIVVDDRVSCIGSANLNHRSVVKDDEIALTVIDRELAGQLTEEFEKDRARCRRVRPEDAGDDRSLWRRIKSAFVSLGRREI